jgi:alanine-glyoxylate transaminase/serine-glyoxylate transaminase/serine-pyruvate transaminase
LSPVTVGQRGEEKIAARSTAIDSWYLDLSLLQRYWGPEHTYHHTAPISLNFALYEALRMVAEEGLEARWERHSQNAALLWEGLEELGLRLHVPLEHRLPSLTAVRIPEGVDDAGVRARLLRDYRIEIGGGLGTLKGRVWRIGLMGDSSHRGNVELLLGALRRILHEP